jgi:hypothetical protein
MKTITVIGKGIKPGDIVFCYNSQGLYSNQLVTFSSMVISTAIVCYIVDIQCLSLDVNIYLCEVES